MTTLRLRTVTVILACAWATWCVWANMLHIPLTAPHVQTGWPFVYYAHETSILDHQSWLLKIINIGVVISGGVGIVVLGHLWERVRLVRARHLPRRVSVVALAAVALVVGVYLHLNMLPLHLTYRHSVDIGWPLTYYRLGDVSFVPSAPESHSGVAVGINLLVFNVLLLAIGTAAEAVARYLPYLLSDKCDR